MDYTEAKRILPNHARWELLNIKKALSSFNMLNTEEENQRLEAVNILLKSRKWLDERFN